MIPRRLRLPAAGLALAALVVLSCADRSRRNPLDAGASEPLDLASPLRALAGDGQVELRWDFTRFEDVRAVRLYRDSGDSTLTRELPAADTSFVDRSVTNGRLYSYRIALEVTGEPELAIAGEHLATPGPERVWVADGGSGLVWRLTPDGRQGLFARGYFPSLSAIAIDGETGDCWVGDGSIGLYRITEDGDVHPVESAVEEAGATVIDPEGRTGWAVAAGGRRVYRFPVAALGDTLPLVELDAAFSDSVGLTAGSGSSLWVADRSAGRVLHVDADGVRLGEWRGLEGIVDVDPVAGECCQAWVLIAGGNGLLRLLPESGRQERELPFAPARHMDVDSTTGDLWIAGEDGIAALPPDGGALLHWPEAEAGRGVVIDGVNEQLWVAAETELSKITLGGLTYRARLTGFSSIVQVAVDPGR